MNAPAAAPEFDAPLDQWQQDVTAATDTWTRYFAPRTYGYITQFAGGLTYCWQAARGDFRLSGTKVGRNAAMKQAEEIMDLPVDEFNRMVVADLTKELRKIEHDIMTLSPSTELLPGYHAGFEAGAADVKHRIVEVLGLEVEP